MVGIHFLHEPRGDNGCGLAPMPPLLIFDWLQPFDFPPFPVVISVAHNLSVKLATSSQIKECWDGSLY